MKHSKLLIKLEKWINVVQKAIIATVIFETILVIIIGVASSQITNQFGLWFGIMIFCSITYLVMVGIRTIYQVKFPGSITEELIAKKELEKNNKTLSRQKTINSYLNQVIKQLNDQTCIIGESENKNLCDEELKDRLIGLLSTVLNNMNIVLNSTESHSTTVGIYFTYYQKFPSDYSKITLLDDENDDLYIHPYDEISDSGIIILKDELDLAKFLPKQLIESQTEKNEALELQTTIIKSYNNNSFLTHSFKSGGVDYTVICSEMPEVCSDSPTGVFFIITQGKYNYHKDLPYTLKIFNRLISNYVYKYNSCITEEIKHKKQKHEEKNQ